MQIKVVFRFLKSIVLWLKHNKNNHFLSLLRHYLECHRRLGMRSITVCKLTFSSLTVSLTISLTDSTTFPSGCHVIVCNASTGLSQTCWNNFLHIFAQGLVESLHFLLEITAENYTSYFIVITFIMLEYSWLHHCCLGANNHNSFFDPGHLYNRPLLWHPRFPHFFCPFSS